MSLSPQEVDFGDQKVIYITEQQASEWTRHATQELIKLYDEKIDLLDRGIIKTKKSLYEIISAQMSKKSFFYNPSQCENKWKSLKRAYVTRLEKNPMLLKTKPRPFEAEVAEILKREKFYTRKSSDIDLFDNSLFEDLNRPPGFSVAKVEAHSEEEEEESDNMKQTMMMDQDDNETEANPEEHSYSFLVDAKRYLSKSSPNERLVGEMTELKEIIKKHNETNSTYIKDNNKTQDKIARHLTQMEQNAEEMLQLKRMKLEKQSEMIQQMKIQNSLIAKLIQKLGN